MSLDVYGFVDTTFESTPDGGVSLILPGTGGGYTGPGGTWEDGVTPNPVPLQFVNIQPASVKDVQLMQATGGTANVSDMRVVYINDGTMLEPDDEGTFAQLLEFSDGRNIRQWRIMSADSRPWRNYCKATVTRYRGAK